MKHNAGFTIIELIAVIIIIGVISVSVTSRLMPNTLLQLQSGRDIVISALFLAQQKAMTQQDAVAFIASGTSIDLQIDGSSANIASTQYPYTLPNAISVSSATISYDGLGHTTATSITLTKGANTVLITITGTGYAY